MILYIASKINIGKDFQADIPLCKKANMSDHNATLVWKPIDNLSQEDEDTIDGYLELACSPAIPHNGRNKELALHLLKGVNGSVKVIISHTVYLSFTNTSGSSQAFSYREIFADS